jgi:hypothetical protein
MNTGSVSVEQCGLWQDSCKEMRESRTAGSFGKTWCQESELISKSMSLPRQRGEQDTVCVADATWSRREVMWRWYLTLRGVIECPSFTNVLRQRIRAPWVPVWVIALMEGPGARYCRFCELLGSRWGTSRCQTWYRAVKNYNACLEFGLTFRAVLNDCFY